MLPVVPSVPTEGDRGWGSGHCRVPCACKPSLARCARCTVPVSVASGHSRPPIRLHDARMRADAYWCEKIKPINSRRLTKRPSSMKTGSEYQMSPPPTRARKPSTSACEHDGKEGPPVHSITSLALARSVRQMVMCTSNPDAFALPCLADPW